MQNEYFIYEGKTNSLVFSMVNIDSEYAKKKKELQLIKNEQLSQYTTVRLGKYKNGNVCFVLKKNSFYEILYMFEEYSCLISEGKWSKEGNLLKLYDSFLDYSFTALIDTNKIIVIDFPNDIYPNKNYSPVESEMLPTIVE